ncbi:glycosyltransferase family 10 domain-containing protein [Parabacteroides bouchesdurhonensis]|uniref:glycosyltransferase family 10 domain-containing protein n=1 Tax=Parabacteroides bouchesdurhonensis TaxID=1936995 RepID=UPI000E526DA6|nr:glycosyltransferase family 10 [Parabacteroides bouchesdurhonensis]RHJ94927.1 hypothetical protein DW095_00355 [Bacteroides sp. AM07-16]
MKKTIRCAFADFWAGFEPTEVPFLADHYNVVTDTQHPDYLFYSCFGREHYKYKDCVKIFWSGENAVPDFNDCDYAMSTSGIIYGDCAIRSYAFYDYSPLEALSEKEMLNRKFCNFIYSNNSNSDPFRVRFFNELSKYKKVDSAGPLLNNMGFILPKGREAKMQFQKQYKFSLAIENSRVPGYTTEKILQPFLAHSLPVYWGNPHISSDYNPNSFVDIMSFSSVEEAIEEIIRLDNDDDAYLEKATAPFWPYGDSYDDFLNHEKQRLVGFYHSIFSQPLEQAYRRARYGWNKNNQEKQLPEKIICKIKRRARNLLSK